MLRALVGAALAAYVLSGGPVLAQAGPAAITGNDAGEWKLQCGDTTTYLNLAYSELNLALSSRLNVVVGTISRPGSITPETQVRAIIANPVQNPCILVRIGPATAR